SRSRRASSPRKCAGRGPSSGWGRGRSGSGRAAPPLLSFRTSMTDSPASADGPAGELPASADGLAAGLREVGYLAGESTALVAYLATQLGKPVLVEGP